ncbi:MAG: glycerol kinase GlpK [Clostridia bacterium]|nr:glycerol kinase GlpK [Clostridia bacterium]
MTGKVLIALDQGTTSSRAVVFDLEGHMLSQYAEEFPQIYPQPGWVEHDPNMILQTQIGALQRAVKRAGIEPEQIAAIGITNQRETTLVWDRDTGRCVHNAIVWQCRRTSEMVDSLRAQGWEETIRQKTGLVMDAYFAGTKIRWILDEMQLQKDAEDGKLCFGTIDSFLIWHMVSGHPHVTDATNAGRTMLFNIREQKWDEELLHMLNIPARMLPKVVDSCEIVGTLDPEILGTPVPVASILGDQHASLFGQTCFEPGMVKNTYGTGCFMLMNTGDNMVDSRSGLLSTMAWRKGGKPSYALEGSVFMGGATMQWLRDEMKFVKNVAESEEIAASIKDTGGVYLVPAFTGLGAPWWDQYARGTLVGMTRGTGRAQIVRAALEAIAYQTCDLLHAMEKDSGQMPKQLQVDGGASANAFLMQFEADIMGIPVVRPQVLETTALGAAIMAGLAVGVYGTEDELKGLWHQDLIFEPRMAEEKREELLHGWHRAVERARDWIEH